MRIYTAGRLASFLTVRGVNKDISEPRRRLIRALTMDYMEWKPEQGYHFNRYEFQDDKNSVYITVDRVRRVGFGYGSTFIGMTKFRD